METTAIIPARNEEGRIGTVVRETQNYVDEVIVIDDASTDRTGHEASEAGAVVLRFSQRRGYIAVIKEGFTHSHGDILVTIDGDGEHDPREIPNLIREIDLGHDLVLGKRDHISRISERFLNFLTNLKVQCTDCGTGFRALTRDLALSLSLRGRCTCGILVLEAHDHHASITEVPITLRKIDKKRGIAFSHFFQIFHVLRALL